MFPLIMAFLGAGIALSQIAHTQAQYSSTGTTAWDIMAVVALIAPLIMLPFTFMMAGGLMSTVSQAIRGQAQGGFKAISGYRQRKFSENMHNAAMGNRWKANNRITGRFNSITGGVGAFMGSENKFGYFRKKVREESKLTHGAIAAAEYARRPSTIASQFRENGHRAQLGDNAHDAMIMLQKRKEEGGFEMTKEEAQRAVQTAQVNGGFGLAQQRFAAIQLGVSGTGYKDERTAITAAVHAAHGNVAAFEDIIGAIHAASPRGGRYDVSDYKTELAIGKRLMRGEVVPDNIYTAATVEGGLAADNTSLARGKPQGTENIAKALAKAAAHPSEIAQAQRDLAIMIDPDLVKDPKLMPEGKDKEALVEKLKRELPKIDLTYLTSKIQGQAAIKLDHMKNAADWGSEFNATTVSEALRAEPGAAEAISRITTPVTSPPPAPTLAPVVSPSTRPEVKVIYDHLGNPLQEVIMGGSGATIDKVADRVADQVVDRVAKQAADDMAFRRNSYNPNLEPPDQPKPPDQDQP